MGQLASFSAQIMHESQQDLPLLGIGVQYYLVKLCLGLILTSLISAIAALNSVPASHADVDTILITANDLKPSECSGINLVNIRTGNGTSANDLILGSAGNDIMNAQGGDDCILGGDGGDRLRGASGADIILGGAGNDILIGNRGDDVLYGQSGDDELNGGRQTDICDGGSGTDTSDGTCETELNIP
jgi:Ca2+-binding RTX toxin-like protein